MRRGRALEKARPLFAPGLEWEEKGATMGKIALKIDRFEKP